MTLNDPNQSHPEYCINNGRHKNKCNFICWTSWLAGTGNISSFPSTDRCAKMSVSGNDEPLHHAPPSPRQIVGSSDDPQVVIARLSAELRAEQARTKALAAQINKMKHDQVAMVRYLLNSLLLGAISLLG
jgi:hypothetical protein